MQDAPFGDSQGELQARPASQKRFSKPKKRAQVSGKDAEEKDKKQRQTVSQQHLNKMFKPLGRESGHVPLVPKHRLNRWRSA
jgi:uncharacterized FlaG/YvyC family protein